MLKYELLQRYASFIAGVCKKCLVFHSLPLGLHCSGNSKTRLTTFIIVHCECVLESINLTMIRNPSRKQVRVMKTPLHPIFI